MKRVFAVGVILYRTALLETERNSPASVTASDVHYNKPCANTDSQLIILLD
jgi:hypothetical protein